MSAKPKRLLGVALMAAVLALSAGAQAADEAGLAKAEALAEKGKSAEARDALNAIIEEDARFAKARLLRAQVWLDLGEPLAAEADLRRALDLGVEEDAIRHLMGDAKMMQGDPYEARSWLTGGSFTPETAGDGHRMLGRLEHSEGNYPAAGTAYDKALAVDPENSLLWVDIARLRFVGGEQRQSLEAVDYAVKLDPYNIRALHFRAELMRDQFGLASSLPWFEEALKIAPKDVPLLTEYAATLGDMGRMREMLKISREVLKLSPRNPRAFFMQATLAARAGKFDLARDLMYRAGGALDERPSAMLLNGIIEYQTGNYNTAIELFHKLLREQPTNRRAQMLLARALDRNGDHALLIKWFGSAAERPDAPPYLLTLVARAYEATGKRDKAAPLLNRAAQPFVPPMQPIPEGTPLDILAIHYAEKPGKAETAVPYVRSLIANNDMAGADRVARSIVATSPGAADAHMLLGDTQLALGNPSGAMTVFEDAAEIRFSENILLRMTETMRRQDQLGQAGAMVTRFLNQNPGNIMASRMLAMAYLTVGDWHNSAALLQNIRVRTGDSDALLLGDLAMAQLRLGDVESAVKNARQAYRVQPSSPVATQAYGMALLEQGKRPKDTVDLLEKAQRISDASPLLYGALGRAYQKAGRKADAQRTLSQALMLGDTPDRARIAGWLSELGGPVDAPMPGPPPRPDWAVQQDGAPPAIENAA